jgi:predicted O-methyltransferase YrrM
MFEFIKHFIFMQDRTIKLNPFIKFVPPGHFYSPIPDINNIKLNSKRIFDTYPKQIEGVNLNEPRQLELLNKFVDYYKEIPFKQRKSEDMRYYFENDNYSYTDAIFLYSMIRFLNPKKIIEVGSGFSSCVMLDTNDLFFDNSISLTCIEPYPQLLKSVIKETDKVEVIENGLQEVDLSVFSKLTANDILFIDSTHISKIDSDVNRIIFEILPALNNGVFIHFHDIFYPFEYPKKWIYEGRAWNEAYLLRAFLQYNDSFEIQIFSNYLAKFHQQLFDEIPLCKNNLGGNIWIKKLVASSISSCNR